MSAQLAIQKAIKSVFVADTGAGGLRNAGTPLVSGVHDFVPPNVLPPYIVLGDATEQPAHTFGKQGWDVSAQIEVWADSPAGFEPVLAAITRMNTLIDGIPGVGQSAALTAALATAGWSMILCAYQSTTPGLRGNDGEVRNKVATYRVLVEAAA